MRSDRIFPGPGGGPHGIAVDSEVGHLGPQIVSHLHGIEASGTAGLQASGFSDQGAPPGGGEKAAAVYPADKQDGIADWRRGSMRYDAQSIMARQYEAWSVAARQCET